MGKKLKACLYVDVCGGTPSENRADAGTAYAAMVEWLTLYVTDCSVLTGIRPFQLGYRPFNIYLVDIGGCPLPLRLSLMAEVGDIARSRPSRLYLFWTGESWEAFQAANPDLKGSPNCINCCDINVFEQIFEILLDMED
jgi:hypothetical protein